MEFRLAQPQDVKGIVDLARISFDAKLLDKIIYGCSGFDKYLSLVLANNFRGRDIYFLIAAEETKIISFYEFRLLSQTYYINYMATDRNFRSRGIGMRMLLIGMNYTTEYHTQTACDIFTENVKGVKFYEGIGFKRKGATYWMVLPLIAPSQERWFMIQDIPQSVALNNLFGFSTFRVTTEQNTYIVGLFENRYFRINNYDGLKDPSLLSALMSLDSNRKMLLLSSIENIPFPHRLVYTSFKYEQELDIVKRRLTDAVNQL